MSCPYSPNADRYKLPQTLLGPMEPKCIGFLILNKYPHHMTIHLIYSTLTTFNFSRPHVTEFYTIQDHIVE